MLIFVKGKGFFESMGWNGIIFTNDIHKAFQFETKSSMKKVKSSLVNHDITILKIVD